MKAPRAIENEVLIGEAGYLFLAGGGHDVLAYVTGRRNVDDAAVEVFRANIKARGDWAERHGARYVHLIMPDKQSIVPAYFPLGDPVRLGALYVARCPEFADALLYPADELAAHKARAVTKVDTHLTAFGSLLVARRLVHILSGGGEAMFAQLLERLGGDYVTAGDLGAKLEPPWQERVQHLDAPPPGPCFHNEIEGGQDGGVDLRFNANAMYDERVAVFGDSFGRDIARCLQFWYRNVYFFRTRYFHEEIASQCGCDILITENVERYMHACAPDGQRPVFGLYPHLNGKSYKPSKAFAEALSAVLSFPRAPYADFATAQGLARVPVSVPEAPGSVPVYIVNLGGDRDDYARLLGALAAYKFLAPRRIEAVPGSTLPDQFCLRMTGDPASVDAKGALGCMLSHIRAWERVRDGPEAWAIILEDDACPLDWSEVPALAPPADFDIVFINSRTAPDDATSGYTDIRASLAAIERRAQAVGGDGYVLSRAGAAKLLEAMQADLYAGHVDWRLLAYAVPVEDAVARVGDGALAGALRSHHAVAPRAPFLKAYVLSPSLVTHGGRAMSTRLREDRLGVARSKVARFDGLALAEGPVAARRLQVLESPRERARAQPMFVADLSGRGLTLASPETQSIHGSDLIRRDDVLLFGPNHLVCAAGHWSCEAQSYKTQFLDYLGLPFYEKMYPGAKPRFEAKAGGTILRTAHLAAADVTVIDTPVFLATPVEPPVWGRWISSVVPRIRQYREHGGGRAFMIYGALDWQVRLLACLGLTADQLLPHDPGKTYLCRDVMTVESSVLNLSVSARERAWYYELAAAHRGPGLGPKLFVSRLAWSTMKPGYRTLRNEAALAAMLSECGFRTIEPQTLTFEAQIEAFAAAEQVVCLGGSALFNTVFCAPGTMVVTIESSARYVALHAELLASLDLRYGVIFGREDEPEAAEPHGAWSVDVGRVKEALLF
jgi:hypothetical protein